MRKRKTGKALVDIQRAALRSARRELGRLRQGVIDGHSIGMSGMRKDVHDDAGLAEIGRLDRLIARLDEALVFFGAQ
jgi:hypothetical protein